MTSQTLLDIAAEQVKPRPDIRPGYTVRVHERIQEGEKARIQVFEGLVIAVHKGATPTSSTFTVRRIASGVGVEKIFPLHAPNIEKIEVKKVAAVRRAKLFFLRGRRGKAARLSERFTTADEFAIAAAEKPEVEDVESVREEKVERDETDASSSAPDGATDKQDAQGDTTPDSTEEELPPGERVFTPADPEEETETPAKDVKADDEEKTSSEKKEEA